MTSTEQYLELLQAGLWNRPAIISAPVHLKDILAAAQHQSTLPLICKAVLDLPGARIKPELAQQLQAAMDKCAASHKAADRIIVLTDSELSAAGMKPVLLKGQGVASYYPAPELRQPGDIDLYVRPEDFDKACGIVETMFGEKSEKDSDKHRCYHVGGTLFLELHKYTETFSPARLDRKYQAISDDGTGSSSVIRQIGGADILTPEDTFNAFYIFSHLWEHTRSMGIGIRQLCDWAVFLHTHAGRLDERRLESYLRAMKLFDVWQVFGAAASHALGLPGEEIPFYDSRKEKRGKLLAGYILDQGNNSEFKHGRSWANRLKHKTGSAAYILRRFRKLFPIFPAKALSQTCGDFARGIGKIFTIFEKK